MASPNQLAVEWLHRYGHLTVPKSDLPKLSMKDSEVVAALASIQSFDANCETLAWSHHNRAIQPDGEFGPATAELMFHVPRCGQPDFAVDPSLDASGSGSWPIPGCNPDDPQRNERHSVRLYVDSRRATSKQKAYLDKVILGAQKCSAEMGLQVYLVNNKADSELSIAFESINGNVIGYFYLFQRGDSCATHLTGMLDVNYQPDWYQFCLLLIHEALGHGLGHQHTSGGIMNPSLLRTPARPGTEWPTWKNDGSAGNAGENRMRSWFGGEEVPVPGDDDLPDPPDPPDPEDGVFFVSGELDIRQADGSILGRKVAGPLIVIPKR